MNRKYVIIIGLILLAFLVTTLVACDDWDGMDRTSDEYNGVLTRQAEGKLLPSVTPISR